MKSRIVIYTVILVLLFLLEEGSVFGTHLRTRSKSKMRSRSRSKSRRLSHDYSHFAEELVADGNNVETRIGSGFSENKLDEESKTLDLNYSNLFRMEKNINSPSPKFGEDDYSRNKSHKSYGNINASQFISRDLLDNSKPFNTFKAPVARQQPVMQEHRAPIPTPISNYTPPKPKQQPHIQQHVNNYVKEHTFEPSKPVHKVESKPKKVIKEKDEDEDLDALFDGLDDDSPKQKTQKENKNSEKFDKTKKKTEDKASKMSQEDLYFE